MFEKNAKHGSDFSEKHAFFKLLLYSVLWSFTSSGSSSDEANQKLFKLCHVSP